MWCYLLPFFLEVWPDFPNVTVNESLDWDTQVEVRLFSACTIPHALISTYYKIF